MQGFVKFQYKFTISWQYISTDDINVIYCLVPTIIDFNSENMRVTVFGNVLTPALLNNITFCSVLRVVQYTKSEIVPKNNFVQFDR